MGNSRGHDVPMNYIKNFKLLTEEILTYFSSQVHSKKHLDVLHGGTEQQQEQCAENDVVRGYLL